MERILYQYELSPTTWVYLSSFITIAVYFKFSRFWSVRNLDLLGLIAFAPGLILVAQGLGLGQAGATANERSLQAGYVWLFGVGLFFLLRLLGDPMMVRRPLLEPNLSVGGLTFTGVALLVFTMANVLTRQPGAADMQGIQTLDGMLGWGEARAGDVPGNADPPQAAQHRPGLLPFHLLPRISSRLWQNMQDELPQDQARHIAWVATARAVAIMAQIFIVIGLVLIGYRHFDNLKTGIAVAALYLLLPYTAQFAGQVEHVVPAALLVWGVFFYRRPLVAGVLLGLAMGVVFYPLFLLPLWAAFYWQRGLARFAIGVVSTLLLSVGLLWLLSGGSGQFFWTQVQAMFGLSNLFLLDAEGITNVDGFWNLAKAPYRLTVFVAFAVLCLGMALWPSRKNLGTLLSCSAVVMLGTQFWHAHQGGLYMAWYLPLLVLTVFRPNLEDRLAISSLDESWFARRRAQLRAVVRAA